jgi:ribosome-associated heat shock protein Hsp15
VTAPEAQRIDKWLWHARFGRTRGAAQRLAVSGHVRLNREKVRTASQLVRVGDVLTLGVGGGVRVIRIVAIAERRGSFQEAQRLYESEGASFRQGGAEGESPEGAPRGHPLP